MIKQTILSVGLALGLVGTAYADSVLILGGEGDSYVSVQTALEAAGHTVTYDAGTVLPGDISGYQQVWDMRLNNPLTADDMTTYDTFLQNNGYLYLTGEHSGFAVRNNSISDFTNTLGGGTITVDGRAIDFQDGADNYFSDGTNVLYSASAIITIDEGGTARVLTTDENGDATGIMYIGNAGDLGEEYNGTVVVIADVNWTQSGVIARSGGANELFLEELINGIVAGTVDGTIDESGTGTAIGGSSEPVMGPLATAQNITKGMVRNLDFDGASLIGYSHVYDNGMEGETKGFSVGGTILNEATDLAFGAGIARLGTDISNEENSASATSIVLDSSIAKNDITFGLRHAMTDYSMVRGDNTGATSATDTSARVMFEASEGKLKPIVGYTVGQIVTDAYVEGGNVATARTVDETDEMYRYATIGALWDINDNLSLKAVRHTDGINVVSAAIGNEMANVNLSHTMTEYGTDTSIDVGIKIEF